MPASRQAAYKGCQNPTPCLVLLYAVVTYGKGKPELHGWRLKEAGSAPVRQKAHHEA